MEQRKSDVSDLRALMCRYRVNPISVQVGCFRLAQLILAELGNTRVLRNGGIPDCASLDPGYAGRIAVAQRRPRLTPVGRRNEAIFAAETQISIAPRRSSGTLKMSLGS